MPVAGWNGKFQGVGNGGWAGVISYPALAERLVADTSWPPPTPVTPARVAALPSDIRKSSPISRGVLFTK